MGISTLGESVSLERKIKSSIFLCIPRDLNILGKSCTTFVIVKIVRNLSRGRSPCQRVNHVKSGVIYFSAFIFSYNTIHVSGTIHTWNRDLTIMVGVQVSLPHYVHKPSAHTGISIYTGLKHFVEAIRVFMQVRNREEMQLLQLL